MLANGRWDLMRRLTLNLLTTTIVALPSNASKWQMGFNSALKGLKLDDGYGAEIISPYYTITNTLPNWVQLAQKRANLQKVDVKVGEAEFRFYYQRCDQANLVEDVAHTRVSELIAVPSYFMFEFPCIIRLYYIKDQQDTTMAVLFISNCKITLHVSDASRVHYQEY
jgi:hypothetical protein